MNWAVLVSIGLKAGCNAFPCCLKSCLQLLLHGFLLSRFAVVADLLLIARKILVNCLFQFDIPSLFPATRQCVCKRRQLIADVCKFIKAAQEKAKSVVADDIGIWFGCWTWWAGRTIITGHVRGCELLSNKSMTTAGKSENGWRKGLGRPPDFYLEHWVVPLRTSAGGGIHETHAWTRDRFVLWHVRRNQGKMERRRKRPSHSVHHLWCMAKSHHFALEIGSGEQMLIESSIRGSTLLGCL